MMEVESLLDDELEPCNIDFTLLPKVLLYEKRNMENSIHISTLGKMLKAGDPVDLKLWTKSGEIHEWRNNIPLRYNFYQGTRQMKLLNSGQIR